MRVSRRWFLVSFAAGAGLVALALAQGAPTRQDADDGSYVVGQLTWRDGSGGIEWASTADTEDRGGDKGLINFTSAPLPHDLPLNASRQIEANLFTKDIPTNKPYGTSCRSGLVVAHLFAGGRVIGYANDQYFQVRGESPLNKPNTTFPPDPDGYGVCRLRFHSELGILPAGTVLRLQLQLGRTILFGFAADHKSVIRLPVFAPDELPYRYPSYAHGAPTGGAATGTLAGELLSGAGLGLVALAQPSRRQSRRALVLAAAFLMVSMAGCAGNPGGSAATDDRPETSVAPAYQHGDTRAGSGWLIGQIKAADVDAPIHGAYVALLGTANSTRTDPYGRFVFKDLAPGDYQLRIDHKGYNPFEGPVAIRKDLVARLNITLAPIGVGDPGTRPHVHDYWSGATTITLLDNESIAHFEACDEYAGCEKRTPTAFVIPERTDGYATILPGTYEVSVTLWWDQVRIPMQTMFLDLQANHDASFENVTTFMARGPGEPVHIATNWEMADPGHQTFSSWLFKLRNGPSIPESDPVAVAQLLASRQLDPPTYQVTVKITKGTVPVERAHPDFWRGGNAVRIMEDVPRAPNIPVGGNWAEAWLPLSIIPPGTTRVDVYANSSRPLFVEYPIDLDFKTSRGGVPAAGCWSSNGNDGHKCTGPDYTTMAATSHEGTLWHWRIDAVTGDADPFYAARSFWVFQLHSRSDPVSRAQTEADNDAEWAQQHWLDFKMTVIAHRTSAAA